MQRMWRIGGLTEVVIEAVHRLRSDRHERRLRRVLHLGNVTLTVVVVVVASVVLLT